MKICVYAICKNEEKFVDSWLESMQEADSICVLDTGSTDGTVERLKKHKKVTVAIKEFTPWRFDNARNESMKLIPSDTDFCVCTDLDERFDQGWRERLEKGLSPLTKQVRYRYTWSHDENGNEGVVFYADKIHSYGDFVWVHPVHEVLLYKGKQPYFSTLIKDVHLQHYPDAKKSRGQYLPLLKLSVEEDPTNDRNMHYLGREYFFHGEYGNAIETLQKHLNLPSATWAEERSASLRYMAKSQHALSRDDEAEKSFKQAILTWPSSREGYYDLGCFYYDKGDFLNAALTLEVMQNISHRQLSYISNPECWSGTVNDLLSICYHNLGDRKKALENCKKAHQAFPNNTRISKNLNYFLHKEES